MKSRRKARELMLKALYQYDIGKNENLEECLKEMISLHRIKNEETIKYAYRLLENIKNNIDKINETIRKFSLNWRLERMAVIDRNILRIAIAEMLFMPDIPEKVSINEAVEISKKYSTEDSYSFVNGILHRVYVTLQNRENEQA